MDLDRCGMARNTQRSLRRCVRERGGERDRTEWHEISAIRTSSGTDHHTDGRGDEQTAVSTEDLSLPLEVCVVHCEFAPCLDTSDCHMSQEGDAVAYVMRVQWGDDPDTLTLW